MSKTKKNSERENRISEEIIVDAYGPEEQAMGWYYYLEEKLCFPFLAQCIAERAILPLRKGDEVEIVGMDSDRNHRALASIDSCSLSCLMECIISIV